MVERFDAFALDADEQARNRQRLARPVILTGSKPPEPAPELSLTEQAGDVLAAPFRGIEAAAQDLYGLADTIALDALPDYDKRFLGESRTTLGGLVEGFVNFGVGMAGASLIPMGWTAKLGRLAPLVRTAVRGAIADFSVFDGNESRLSNLVQSFPSLQNPITEFLSAKEDDPEIEGRLKNALEGLGIGAAIDLVHLGLKGLRAGRIERVAQAAAGVTGKPAVEATERAIDKAAPPAAMQAALAKVAPPPLPPVHASPDSVLRSFGLDDAKITAIRNEIGQREAPFSHATLTARDPLDPRVNPRKLSQAELLEQGMMKHDLNLSAYQGSDGALNLLRATEQLLPPVREARGLARQEFNASEKEAIQGLSEMVGRDMEGFLARGREGVQNVTEAMSKVQSYRMATLLQSQHAYDMLSRAAKSTDDKDLLRAAQALETAAELQSIIKGYGYAAGRGLQSLGQTVRALPVELLNREAVEAALHERGGRKKALDLVAKAKTLMDASLDPVTRAARVNDLASGAFGKRTFGVLNEFWYNSLLGRPTTTIVNAMSNALTAVYKPMELIAGGLIGGDSMVLHDGVREIQNLVHSAGEAWSATSAALRGDGYILDPKSLLADINNPARKAITAANLGVNPDSIHGQALDWLGKLVRMPSTVLTATDQFFQQLNYRTVARSQLTREMLEKGVPVEGVAAAVDAEMEKLIHRGQAYGAAQLYHRGVEEAMRGGLRGKAAVDEAAREFVNQRSLDPEHARLSRLGEIATQRAQEATFTAPLTPGTVPYRIQEAAINHWYVRMIMPFVRTPINILGFAHDRGAGAVSGAVQLAISKAFPGTAEALEHSRNRFLQDMLSGDARRVADARGRLALGMSTAAFLITKAAERGPDGLPLITGRGPADKEQRQILENAGWQPYSIRIGGRYVSYGRLDPFATIIGTVADVQDYARYAQTEDQSAVETFSTGLAVALAHNLVNKTYLQGLAGAIDMVQDPDRRFAPWYRTLAASFVPGAAAGLVSVTDPLLRDVRSLLDAGSARLPGLSATLPSLRNVLGEPVKRAQSLGSDASSVANAFVPILYREVSDDVVNKEMAALQYGFTPPKRQRGGLDLTDVPAGKTNAYDRWLELHGTVQMGGRTLRQALRRLIQSKTYQQIPVDSTVEIQSPRIQMVQSVIDDYRAAAFRQLLREVPALGQAELARQQRRAELVRGQESRPAILDALRAGPQRP